MYAARIYWNGLWGGAVKGAQSPATLGEHTREETECFERRRARLRASGYCLPRRGALRAVS